ITVTDPVAAGKNAVAQLRRDGAAVVVGLLQSSSKRNVLALAKAIGGIDFAVAGLGNGAPEPDQISPRAEDLGNGTYLIIPANRGQIVSRVDVMIRDAGPLVDAIGPGAARDVSAQLDRQLASLDKDLAAFATDPSADQAFVAAKKAERVALVADKESLAKSPWRTPVKGSFFGFEQVKINKALGCDPAIQKATNEYNRAVGEANIAFAKTQPVMALPKGAPSYVGAEACADCHQDAVDFWQSTRHAHAWKTLEDRNQQFDLDCIGCHVTGWDKPSGATMANNEKLRDVQCEVCHAPASIHVAKGGEEQPLSIMKEPPPDLCANTCHTKEHSDTFERTAYLRDILGKGHGERDRQRLGDGPTGKSLRTAALEKAGKLLGPGCMK
ncbi:MAG TPA: multiheme c-type cytochrome, partial [Kofleriaceae bacterium]|nr:multiheme c-type cytochrome [Kofleriaceae bacterium]